MKERITVVRNSSNTVATMDIIDYLKEKYQIKQFDDIDMIKKIFQEEFPGVIVDISQGLEDDEENNQHIHLVDINQEYITRNLMDSADSLRTVLHYLSSLYGVFEGNLVLDRAGEMLNFKFK